MGDDYSNRQIHVGDSEPASGRDRVKGHLRDVMLGLGYLESDKPADDARVFAIGPPARWICLYDSFYAGDPDDEDRSETISLLLSTCAPIVEIDMDDTAAVHLRLYDSGSRLDQFANGYAVCQDW